MKRILFCASVLALATSCADNELDSFATSGEKQANGITFVADAPLSRMQWDETETSYVPFWYAEQDRIAIYAIGAKGGNSDASGATSIDGDGWNDLDANVYTYKATQSEKVGKFTATADDQTLHFDGGKEARFLALYPAISGNLMTAEWSEEEGKVGIKISDLPNLANQTQTTTKGDNQSIMMYSLSKASKVNDYDAVGESAKLSFQRPFSALVLSTDNADEYTKGEDALFGKLKTVTVTATGYTPDQGEEIDPSLLTYNSDSYLVVDTLTNKATFFEEETGTAAASTAELTLGTGGLGWSDDALAVVAINNVDRSQTFAKQQKDETIDITWTFENIVLKQSLKTQNSWNGFIECPKLDISSYDYLVTNDKQLVVLKGNFKDIFVTEGDDKGKIEWASGNVDKTAITTIISKVALSNEELAMLKEFTSLKSLTLAENTEIPANTFTAKQAAAITKLDLPKVTKVDQKFIANDAANKFSALTDLAMASYEFEDATVNGAFFNNTIQGTLKTLDMSGVRSMLPKFGIERTLSFNGYTALTEVTVQDGMIVSPSGFAGCKALKTVNGAVDITSAPNAFKMAAGDDANNALETIEISGTEIPAYAFYCCPTLKTITNNGANVVPTFIGAQALAATGIEYMDLSKLAEMGANAFLNSAITSSNKDTDVLEVGASEIPTSAFEGCTNIKMVKFTNATKITGTNIFNGATNLIQVKFLKAVSLANATADAYVNVFGGREGQIDLWTNPEQTGVDGVNWTLNYTDGKATYSQTYTFKSIQKKIED